MHTDEKPKEPTESWIIVGEEEEEEKLSTFDAEISVKVIRHKGQAALVEWSDSGRFRRTVVPRESVTEDERKRTFVSESDLSMGIPYGVDWESRLRETFVITGANIAEKLEGSGIWTKEDYIKNPSVVQQSVLAAAQEILRELSAITHNIPNK